MTVATDPNKTGVGGSQWTFYPETYGATGNGTTDDAVALQACADAVSAAGGGVLQLGPKTYIVGAPVYIRSNTIVQGCGMLKTSIKAKSGVTYGPTSAGVATSFACLWLADSVDLAAGTTTAASNVMVRDLKCEPRESVNGSTGYNVPITMGVFLGRLAAGQIAQNVGVERVWVDEPGIGIGLGQRGTPTAPVVLGSLHQNFWAKDCRITFSRNKAIEFQQCAYSRIVNNVCLSVNHGPQLIHECQWSRIEGNYVAFNDYGIGVANACHGITVANNHVRHTGNFPFAGDTFPRNYTSFSSFPVGYNIKADATPGYVGSQNAEDVKFTGNTVDMIARGSGDGVAWSFGGANTATCTWQRFEFIGDVYLNCKPLIGRGIESAPSSYAIDDITMENCKMPAFTGASGTAPTKVVVQGGRVTANMTLDNATNWVVSGMRFDGTLTLSATTNSVKVVNNVLAAGAVGITDSGTTNTKTNNT